MSTALRIRVMQRWGMVVAVMCFIIALLFGIAVGTAFGQGIELASGMRVASDMKDATLGQWALILCGMCVAALVYMAQLMVKWHTQILKEAVALTELRDSVNALIGMYDTRWSFQKYKSQGNSSECGS